MKNDSSTKVGKSTTKAVLITMKRLDLEKVDPTDIALLDAR